ncbi:cystatin-A-like [Rana temporaria]|uniref:cystatin-A-like n=1 Tax=Rana temporaria TaxID=8407 RepID=UPI001AADA218|nr:cystatin-A-like [Rana temporaria]
MSQSFAGDQYSVPGGVGRPRLATREDQSVLDKVKKEFVKLSGINPSRFKAVLVSTQVVAGKNYFFKVETGDNSYIHIKAFVPMHQRSAEPSLVAFQLNKEREEDLEYF